MLRLLLRLVLFLIPIVLVCTPVLLLLSAIQPQPLVKQSRSVAHEDVGRINALLKQHDPRTLRDGEVRSLTVGERDLNLMMDTALPRLGPHRTELSLNEGSAEFRVTASLPDNPVGKYLNMAVSVEQLGDRLQVQAVHWGALRLPARAIQPVVLLIERQLELQFAEYRDMMSALQQVHLRQGRVDLVYRWNAELALSIQSRGRELFIPEADRERIIAYYAEIVRQSHQLKGRHSLTALLQPLFLLAARRSEERGNPAAENRALLLALGVLIRGSSLQTLLGGNSDELPPRPAGNAGFTLAQRGDLTQHFVVSAAITATAGVGLADAAGIFKEMDDARGGSGFSFPDLLADRAGVVLAEVAMGSRASELQHFMSTSPRESDFMPDISHLPEGLKEREFKRRYRDLDSASYALVNNEIERRIAACALYK